MQEVPKSDHQVKVNELLDRIGHLERSIGPARDEKRRADSHLNRLECELSNTRAELTRVIAPLLDRSTLDMAIPRPQHQRVEVRT